MRVISTEVRGKALVAHRLEHVDDVPTKLHEHDSNMPHRFAHRVS